MHCADIKSTQMLPLTPRVMVANGAEALFTFHRGSLSRQSEYLKARFFRYATQLSVVARGCSVWVAYVCDIQKSRIDFVSVLIVVLLDVVVFGSIATFVLLFQVVPD